MTDCTRNPYRAGAERWALPSDFLLAVRLQSRCRMHGMALLFSFCACCLCARKRCLLRQGVRAATLCSAGKQPLAVARRAQAAAVPAVVARRTSGPAGPRQAAAATWRTPRTGHASKCPHLEAFNRGITCRHARLLLRCFTLMDAIVPGKHKSPGR